MLGFLVFIIIKQMGRRLLLPAFLTRSLSISLRGGFKEFAPYCNLSLFACRPSVGWWTCVVHGCLMDSLIGEGINIRAKGRQGGLIREERGWREWLRDKYCECKNDWKSVWWKEIDCPNQRNYTAEPRLPCLGGFWGLSATRLQYHAVMNSLNSYEWIAVCVQACTRAWTLKGKIALGRLTSLLF